MMDLKNREIFAVGTWNGLEFSEADLDDIVANFEKLADTHKVPLKFGHDADHKDGQPAIGWISRLFKQGQKLYADFTDMPKTVFEAIKNKLYRAVSVELLFNVENGGKRFNHVLDAVALLGADHPAVTTLADLDALLAMRTSFAGGHRIAFETVAGKKPGKPGTTTNHFVIYNDKEDDDLEIKEVEALIAKAIEPLEQRNAKLEKELKESNEANAKFKADQAETDKAEKAKKVKMAREAVVNVLDEAVKSKALTPAMREVYEKQIGVEDDDRVVKIELDEVKKMFNVTKDNMQTGLHKKADDDEIDPEAKLMALTHENQSKTGEKDFGTAFMSVARANPELHKAYLNLNGEAKR